MKNKNIGYLFKEGIRGVFLHGFMSFAAICVTVACLILIGSFYLIMINLNKVVSDLDQQNQIVAFVELGYNEAEAKNVGSKINMIPTVSKAEFVSNEEALSSFLASQSNPEAFSGMNANDFRHRFVITLESSSAMKETKAELEKIEGVAKVSAKLEIAEGFSTVKGVLKIISTALIAVLFVVSLFIISNTVKLAMYDRKEEIAIMKMVGATNGFIRLPFIVEGFFIGIISAAVAFFAEWGLYDYLCDRISEIESSVKLFVTIPFSDVLRLMVIAYLAAGLLVGILGSLLSIRKFLDV